MRVLSFSSSTQRSDALACRLMSRRMAVVHCDPEWGVAPLQASREVSVVLIESELLRSGGTQLEHRMRTLPCAIVIALIGQEPADRLAAWSAGAHITVRRDLPLNALAGALAAFGNARAPQAGIAPLNLNYQEREFLELLIARQGGVLHTRCGLSLSPGPGRRRRVVAHRTLSTMLCRLRRKFDQVGVELPVRCVHGRGFLLVSGCDAVLPAG
jgi:DNA-binding response OmpR family regulator